MVLVTGGTGYIGSHTLIELINSGKEVCVIDNLSNSSIESIKRVEQIVGKGIPFVQGDVRNKTLLRKIFRNFDIDSVIHFAGLKSVGESTQNPLKYYDNNVAGTLSICEVMIEFDCKKIVFSSSATVYGNPESVPIKEESPLRTTNPYGSSKLMVEDILRDLHASDPSWSIAILRYFNPVGAHKSGLIGEDPRGLPSNLMPFLSLVAQGTIKELEVFGDDYPTADGTGVRDYIHVVDLARGHLSALNEVREPSTLITVNLGTGKGYSVLDMVKTFERVTGQEVPYKVVKRRPGDVAECYADSCYAKNRLGWTPVYGLEQMCEDVWQWQKLNPKGY